MQKNTINIKNRKARFNYEILEKYTAGIKLMGTEIKAIREGKANIAESFCEFQGGELFAINMHIQEYSHATHFNHAPRSQRKLLLNKSELRKWNKKVTKSGLTIIPLKMFISKRGLAKLSIGLCKGKQTHDKRQTIKKREDKRRMDRVKKEFNT
jgi:SsrA-binding protein